MLGKMENKIRVMEYPILAGAPLPVTELETPVDPFTRVRELEARLAEREKQFTRQLEAARTQAIEQGRQLAGGDEEAWRQQCSQHLAAALEEFRAHRDEYLGQVEHEVVRLALAIAERILHRESQLDPLLLSGAVRVALGQLADSTEVRLRVAAPQQALWEEMLRLMPGLPARPQVVADPEMQPFDAILESGLGTVDLGVRAQLAEIERGFFDLLDVRKETQRDEARAGKQA